MKLNRLILILIITITSLYSATWQIDPSKKVVYSTNSGVKLKIAAVVSETDKKIYFQVQKKDNTKFKNSGTLNIKFSNGYEKLVSYSGGIL